MRRPGVLAVVTAALLALSGCSGEPAPVEPDAELLVDLPELFAPPAFDAAAGFALTTGTGPQPAGTPGRDTWELTASGVASFAAAAGGRPVIESTTLTGVSRWRVEVADPLTWDPLAPPSLQSVLGEDTTWLVLVEHGTEAGSTEVVSRLTTYDADTGELGVRASVPGTQSFVGSGGTLVFRVDGDPAAAQRPSTVIVDPRTGAQTRYDPTRSGDGTATWEDLVLDVHDRAQLVRRTCLSEAACPDGPVSLRYDRRLVPHGNDDAVSHPGLFVTPGGTTVGRLDLSTGAELPACTGPETAVWSPSGRFAAIAGDLVDFQEGMSVCQGRYPQLTAIDDRGFSYGTLQRESAGYENAATFDWRTGVVTTLPLGVDLPMGIGTGGYGVFRTATAVVVLPPS
jgi:hypothetical protein